MLIYLRINNSYKKKKPRKTTIKSRTTCKLMEAIFEAMFSLKSDIHTQTDPTMSVVADDSHQVEQLPT